MKRSSAILLGLVGLLVGLSSPAQATTRDYYIAAEVVEWDYAPSGKNLIRPGMGLDVWGLHRRYKKYRYIQYTDASYTQTVAQPDHRGILGPEIRAVEGDTIKVHFYNKADKPLTIHPHGVHYDDANEGADLKGKGGFVKPGEKFTYTWTADKGSAPGPADPSSVVWLYHSHVDSVTEIYDGLIGTLVITRKGMQRSDSDPRPMDVDVSLTAMFLVFDENGREMRDQPPAGTAIHNEEAIEEGHLKHAINGRIFGNLPGFAATEGDRVRWHLIGMGTEVDLHTAHWHGETVLEGGKRTDVVELLPASMKSVDMIADNPGKWLFHCHVTDHITAGMSTRWQVKPRAQAAP